MVTRFFQKLKAGHHGHFNIREDDIRFFRSHDVPALAPIRGSAADFYMELFPADHGADAGQD